jgi:hypothetical protein
VLPSMNPSPPSSSVTTNVDRTTRVAPHSIGLKIHLVTEPR